MRNFFALFSIGLGAACGALLRFWFGLKLNAFYPPIPLGTLTANILGGFLIGLFMGVTRNHALISENVRLAITTGFLGGLTTFSTFSAETVTLFSQQEYFLTIMIIICHLFGSLLATIAGFFVIRLLIS